MEQEKLIALVKKAQGGDSTAMEHLLTHAHTAVSYQCRKFMNTPEDAEDMTQEVLLVIYQKLDSLADPAAFNGWVKRIAATRCMNAVSRTHVELQFAEDEDGNSFIDTIEELDKQKIPDAAMDDAETARMVVELIDALPEAQRICTYLYYYDELSIKEIAELTAATENTVKSRLNYARKAIKEGVLDHEKKGIKLYGLSPLPFLMYYLRMAAQAETNEAAAVSCVAHVMASNTAAMGAATSATATMEAVTASGRVATHVVGFLSKKLIAGIVAGAVALGGGTFAAAQLTNQSAEQAPETVCQHEWVDASCTDPKTCHKCGCVEGEALGHTWLRATCETAKTCEVCRTIEGEALGHDWIDASCETAKTCSVCHATEGEPLGHDMAEASTQAPATCKICGHTEGKPLMPAPTEATEPTEPTEATEPTETTEPTEPTEATEPTETTEPTEPQHKHDYSSTTTAPTCGSNGYTTYTCACGDEYRADETPATGNHSYTTNTIVPTTDAEGYDIHTCSVCGVSYKDNYTEKLPAHEHEWVWTEYVGPHACQEGYMLYTCACGESYKEGTGDVCGCAFEPIEVVAPTTEEMGYTVYKCSVCGNTWTDYDRDKLPASTEPTEAT